MCITVEWCYRQMAVIDLPDMKANQMQVILSLWDGIRCYSHKWSWAELLLHVCVYCVTVSSWVHASLIGMRKSKAPFCWCDVTLNMQRVVTHTKNSDLSASSSSSAAHFLYSSSSLSTLFCEHSNLLVYFVGERELSKEGNMMHYASSFKG